MAGRQPALLWQGSPSQATQVRGGTEHSTQRGRGKCEQKLSLKTFLCTYIFCLQLHLELLSSISDFQL